MDCLFFHSKLVRMILEKYYMPLVEIKNFIALTDSKQFFDQTIKNKHEAYEKHVGMSRKDYYSAGILLDYSCR